MNEKPIKLEIGQYAFNRHYDVWCYKSVPEGMRPATAADITFGRMLLYKVRIGPDAGSYYTSVVTAKNHWVFLYDVAHDWPVYVKN
jgi:hypothetical protein